MFICNLFKKTRKILVLTCILFISIYCTKPVYFASRKKKSDLAILILHVDVILSDVAILHEKNNNLGC